MLFTGGPRYLSPRPSAPLRALRCKRINAEVAEAQRAAEVLGIILSEIVDDAKNTIYQSQDIEINDQAEVNVT